MNKISSIFYVFLLFFLIQGTSLAAGCTTPIFSSNFSNPDKWDTSGHAKFITVNGKRILQIKPSSFWDSRASVKLDSRNAINKFLVIKALIKSDHVVEKKSRNNVAKIILELKIRHGLKRRELRFSGTFNWGYHFLVVQSPRDTRDILLSLEHDGSSGTAYFKKIDVYSCNDKKQLEAFDYPESWNRKIDASPHLTAKLSLANLKWDVLNKDIYGVNSAHPYLKTRYIDTLNLKSVLDLKLNIIRFPGGARANYYHWKYDGYNPEELKNFGIYKSRWSRKIFKHFSHGRHKRGLDDFSHWAKAHHVSAALLLNVITISSPDEPINFISHAISQGLPVKYVELGNELYFKNQRGNDISDAADYVNVVKPIIKLIRSKYPSIKIGIPVFHGKNKWNATLEKANLDVDAIIPHAYAQTSSVATISEDKLLFDYAKHTLPSLLDYLKSLFPGKEIWISEWNFQDRPVFRRTNSLVSVIYMAHYLMSMLRDSHVDYSAYHSLISKPFGLMEIANENSFPGSLILKYPYYFWKEIGSIFADTSMTAGVTSVQSVDKNYQPYIDEHIRIQSFRGGKSIYLLIINDDASSVKFNIGNYNLKNIPLMIFSTQGGIGPVRLKPGDKPPMQNTKESGILTIPALSVTIAGPLE